MNRCSYNFETMQPLRMFFSLEELFAATVALPIIFSYLTEITSIYGFISFTVISYFILYLLLSIILIESFLKNPLITILVSGIGLISIAISCLISPAVYPYIFNVNSTGYYGFLTTNIMSYISRTIITIIVFSVGLSITEFTNCLKKYCIPIAVIYILMNLSNFIVLKHATNYMNNAYMAFIPVALLYSDSIAAKSPYKIALAVAAAVFLVLSGSRGAALSMILFITIYHIFIGKLKAKKVITLFIIIALAFIFVLRIEEILSWIANVFSTLGWSTRLIDLINGSESGVFKSNARELLYADMRAEIEWVGSGLFYDRILTNGAYAHNVIWEILLNFGYLIGIPILILMGYKIFIFSIKRHKDKVLGPWVAILLASMCIKYMVSMSYLISQDFWILFCIAWIAGSKYYQEPELPQENRQ